MLDQLTEPGVGVSGGRETVPATRRTAPARTGAAQGRNRPPRSRWLLAGAMVSLVGIGLIVGIQHFGWFENPPAESGGTSLQAAREEEERRLAEERRLQKEAQRRAEERQRQEEARRHLLQAAATLASQARIYRGRGDHEAALESIRNALALTPEQADLLALQGELQKAEEERLARTMAEAEAGPEILQLRDLDARLSGEINRQRARCRFLYSPYDEQRQGRIESPELVDCIEQLAERFRLVEPDDAALPCHLHRQALVSTAPACAIREEDYLDWLNRRG